jgi:hypothetical protein
MHNRWIAKKWEHVYALHQTLSGAAMVEGSKYSTPAPWLRMDRREEKIHERQG